MSVGWGWDDKKNLERIAVALEEQTRIQRDVLDIQQEQLAINREVLDIHRRRMAIEVAALRARIGENDD